MLCSLIPSRRNRRPRAQQQLRQIEESGTFDEAKVRTLASEQSQTMTELIVEKAKIHSQIFNILTPDQKVHLVPLSASVGPPPGDTTPPTTSITSPANGATVSGIVLVSASAADNTGVTRVDFLVDAVGGAGA